MTYNLNKEWSNEITLYETKYKGEKQAALQYLWDRGCHVTHYLSFVFPTGHELTEDDVWTVMYLIYRHGFNGVHDDVKK